jgi:hypothetical protein
MATVGSARRAGLDRAGGTTHCICRAHGRKYVAARQRALPAGMRLDCWRSCEGARRSTVCCSRPRSPTGPGAACFAHAHGLSGVAPRPTGAPEPYPYSALAAHPGGWRHGRAPGTSARTARVRRAGRNRTQGTHTAQSSAIAVEGHRASHRLDGWSSTARVLCTARLLCGVCALATSALAPLARPGQQPRACERRAPYGLAARVPSLVFIAPGRRGWARDALPRPQPNISR